jgi:AcrR family transcriptional regulator
MGVWRLAGCAGRDSLPAKNQPGKRNVHHLHADTGMGIAGIDGRVLRGIRTREAIIASMRELFLTSGREPTLKEIADRATVSPRIVLKHYRDVGGLLVALLDHLRDEIVTRYAAIRPSPVLDDRIAGFVTLRLDLCERLAPLWLRAVQMDRHTSQMDRLVRRGYADLRGVAAHVFAEDLRSVSFALQRDLLDQLALHVDAYTWRYHRQICGRTPAETGAVIHSAIRRLLT